MVIISRLLNIICDTTHQRLGNTLWFQLLGSLAQETLWERWNLNLSRKNKIENSGDEKDANLGTDNKRMLPGSMSRCSWYKGDAGREEQSSPIMRNGILTCVFRFLSCTV